MTSHQLDLHAYVDELTRPHTHREHYEIRRGTTRYAQNHTTRVPPLLAQLKAASPSGNVEGRDNHGYGSRPAARLEALDTLMLIDREAARWVRFLGADDPGDTTACIRLLGGLAPSQDKKTQEAIERDVRRWWTWSRIVAGWDSPAWRPDNTCPACGARRTLRINLIAQAAFCVEDSCGETWDASRIGLLAEHIRAESEQERIPPPAPVPCHCRWPGGLQEQGRWGVCPVCGSVCCVNAEAVAAREDQTRRRRALERRLEELERIAADYRRRQRRGRAS